MKHEIMHISGADGETLIFTIDSGASENVISEEMASRYPTRPSAGSQRGLVYTAANGTTMANKGEKEVTFMTGEGHTCMMKMQVTDVQRPLISVSRLCDAGHKVVFTRAGGYIQHEGTSQVTSFYRDHNVYRMEVAPTGGSRPGFTWQGM